MYNANTKVRIMVHGDDFIIIGPLVEVEKVKEFMDARFKCKRTLLHEKSEDKVRHLTGLVDHYRTLAAGTLTNIIMNNRPPPTAAPPRPEPRMRTKR